MGFIASDGAIKIHKRGCPNARHLMNRYPYRTIKAAWSEIVGGNQFAVPLSIIGNDDIGIVNNITSLITKEKVYLCVALPSTRMTDCFKGVLSSESTTLFHSII